MAGGTPVPTRSASPRMLSPARWRVRLRRVLLVADVLVIAVASLGAFAVREALGEADVIGQFTTELPVAFAVLPLWLGILYLFGCYEPAYQNQGSEAFRRFLGATTVAVMVLGFVSFLFRLDLSRIYVGLTFVLALLLGTVVRGGIRAYLRQRRGEGDLIRNVLIVGCDDEAAEVARALLLDDTAGYRVVGYVDDDHPSGHPVSGDLIVLGGTDEVLQLAYEHDAGLVIIAPTSVGPGTLRDLTVALEGSPVDLAVAPSLFEVVTRRVAVESVANVPILHVSQIRLTGWKAFAKRTLDIVGAIALLAVLWPVMLAAVIAIRLDDRGPVLFRQTRVGREGAQFTLLKFRTMITDAEDRLREVEHLNEAGHHFFKIRDDPRVTRVGAFLRKWSIDETPQLWNVLRGDMSLVGPRPPLPSEVARYEAWHMRRLRVRPGVTGVWQVSGRSSVPFDEAVRMDLFYIENWSLGFDLYLLARTVLAVLGRYGAY